jgi:hypothetical protein
MKLLIDVNAKEAHEIISKVSHELGLKITDAIFNDVRKRLTNITTHHSIYRYWTGEAIYNKEIKNLCDAIKFTINYNAGRLQAIKIIKQNTGLNLKETKEIVDQNWANWKTEV